MVKEIISGRHPVVHYEKRIEFDLKGRTDGLGYSFAADDNWNPVFSGDPADGPVQRHNYDMCQKNPAYAGPYFRTHERHYTEDARAVCEMCGNEIILSDQYLGASECPHCGTWHNIYGQTLVSPDLWHPDGEY